ncbi:MAG: hypothetical protein ABJD53_13150 [Gammaproteobacteria bacterium]
MSAIANLRSAPAAFPPLNLHPYSHKKGPHVRSPEDSGSSSDSAAAVPKALRQNLFGSLLNSLERAIGVQLTAPATAASASTNVAAGSTHAATAGPTNSTGADSPSAAAPATSATVNGQSSITLLQNYLNNLAHNPRTDGPPAATFAGSNVSISV